MAKGMPSQGAKAVIKGWSDANEMVLNYKKSKDTKPKPAKPAKKK